MGLVKKDTEKSQREKAYLDQGIAFVEPMVESYTQFHIMLFLYVTSPNCFGVSDQITMSSVYFYLKLAMSFSGFILASYNFATNGPLALGSYLHLNKTVCQVAVGLIVQLFYFLKLIFGTLHIYLLSLNRWTYSLA